MHDYERPDMRMFRWLRFAERRDDMHGMRCTYELKQWWRVQDRIGERCLRPLSCLRCGCGGAGRMQHDRGSQLPLRCRLRHIGRCRNGVFCVYRA